MWKFRKGRNDHQEYPSGSDCEKNHDSDSNEPTDAEDMNSFDEFDSLINDLADTRRKSIFLEEDPEKISDGSMVFESHCYPVTSATTENSYQGAEREVVSNLLRRRRCVMLRSLLVLVLAIGVIVLVWIILVVRNESKDGDKVIVGVPTDTRYG